MHRIRPTVICQPLLERARIEWFSRTVPDVKHDQLVVQRHIEDQVRVHPQRDDTDGWPRCNDSTAGGKICHQLDDPTDALLDSCGAVWVPLNKIVGNLNEIAKRSRTASNPHLRKRANTASTSAGLALSPRSTCVRASSMAASSSDDGRYGPGPRRSSASSSIAASS
jgi:hypothetical protein